ncbi:YfiR family protein [uncultured Photobacterium sp.]|uniref:YfiR family protein n=1 Tax=uncultured Photobacterium sp. TaxID=173973 RepID=UPI0026383815|nr:YfiR family protein [uncultured Photobacterium sp.]
MKAMFQFPTVFSHQDPRAENFWALLRKLCYSQLPEIGCLAIACCLSLITLPKAVAAQPNLANYADYKIRAVYVHHFANFVHWPEKLSKIQFCSLGRDNVSITLSHLIKEKQLPGYQASFTSLNNLSEASSQCEILYLTERKMRKLQRIPQYAKVLTVSSSANFLDQGGMIELRSINNQVKPAIEINNVERGQLTVSSQLLRIALRHTVHTGDNND